MEHFKKGFTLVELIVVVTILAILATIGFVSYSSYLVGVRDTNRLSQLRSISDGLNLYTTTNTLPVPEDSVEVNVTVSGVDYDVGIQGYVGANVLESIDFDKGGTDPKDNSYFTYIVTKDRKSFQLMAFLEESSEFSYAPVSGVHASFYSDRVPIVSGDDLGVLTDIDYTPIQEVPLVTLAGELLLDGTGPNYIIHTISSEEYGSNDSTLLYPMYVDIAGRGNRNCKEIRDKHPYVEGADGSYWIKTTSENMKIPCDMTTEGGGWTLVLHGTDTDMENYDSRGANNWKFSQTFIPFKGDDFTFKLPDSTLNQVRNGGDYMLIGDNISDAPNTFFTPSSCTYDHEALVSGPCESMFNDIAFSNTAGLATSDNTNSAKGIGVRTSGIITHFTDSLATCYEISAGGCTSSSNQVSVKMYVR